MSKHFLLVRGLPGSGKTTYVKDMCPDYLHYEADMYFEQDGDYNFDNSKLGDAHRWCLANFNLAIKRGLNVAVANTFTTMKEMRNYLKVAKEAGYEITIVEMKTNYGSIHNVPQSTLDRMQSRWQKVPSDMYDTKIIIEDVND